TRTTVPALAEKGDNRARDNSMDRIGLERNCIFFTLLLRQKQPRTIQIKPFIGKNSLNILIVPGLPYQFLFISYEIFLGLYAKPPLVEWRPFRKGNVLSLHQ